MTREEEIKFRDECAMRVMVSMYEQRKLGNDPMTKEDFLSRGTIFKEAFDYAESLLEEKKKRDEKLS